MNAVSPYSASQMWAQAVTMSWHFSFLPSCEDRKVQGPWSLVALRDCRYFEGGCGYGRDGSPGALDAMRRLKDR